MINIDLNLSAIYHLMKLGLNQKKIFCVMYTLCLVNSALMENKNPGRVVGRSGQGFSVFLAKELAGELDPTTSIVLPGTCLE